MKKTRPERYDSHLIKIKNWAVYAGRLLSYGLRAYDTQDRFPFATAAAPKEAFHFNEEELSNSRTDGNLGPLSWTNLERKKSTGSLTDVLKSNKTTAFMIIKDDMILYEKYFEGRTRQSLFPSFSTAKSITSALIGIALDENLIPGIETPVQQILPEFRGAGYEKITVRNLLEMNSGFRHKYGTRPSDHLVISGYHPDAWPLSLKQKTDHRPGEVFNYNNYHTVLLGMILNRVSGLTPSKFLEKKLWQPIGAEHDARWNLTAPQGHEYMALGINASVIDYAKFARLYLRNGDWEGYRVISPEWVVSSTTTDPSAMGDSDYYDTQIGDVVNEYFAERGLYYSRHWWGNRLPSGGSDFYAIGMFGQYFYICPEKNTVILRMGRDYGDVRWWPDLFRQIAERL